MTEKKILSSLVISTGLTVLVMIGCGISMYLMMNTLNKCTLSRNALYTLSNFGELRPGPIVENTLLNIKEKAFNFSLKCPMYEQFPRVSLKHGYIIPVHNYNATIYHSGDYLTIHYNFKELEEGDYSLHFMGGNNRCIFNTSDNINSHIPYTVKNSFPMTNMTYSNRHRYNTPFSIQGPNFVFLTSPDSFVVKVNSDNGKDMISYDISSYENGVPYNYHAVSILYSGNIGANITLTVTGKRVIYWINTDGKFYRNTTFYNDKCQHLLKIPVIIAIITGCLYIAIDIILLVLSIHLCIQKKMIENI